MISFTTFPRTAPSYTLPAPEWRRASKRGFRLGGVVRRKGSVGLRKGGAQLGSWATLTLQAPAITVLRKSLPSLRRD